MCHHHEPTGEWEALVRADRRARREESEDETPEPRTDHAEPDAPTADD